MKYKTFIDFRSWGINLLRDLDYFCVQVEYCPYEEAFFSFWKSKNPLFLPLVDVYRKRDKEDCCGIYAVINPVVHDAIRTVKRKYNFLLEEGLIFENLTPLLIFNTDEIFINRNQHEFDCIFFYAKRFEELEEFFASVGKETNLQKQRELRQTLEKYYLKTYKYYRDFIALHYGFVSPREFFETKKAYSE